MSSLSLRLPDSLHKAAKKIAKKEHVSINQLITLAVAEKISTLATADYLQERAKRGNKKKFLDILNNVADSEPDDFDKL